jgi:hypothetical protein
MHQRKETQVQIVEKGRKHDTPPGFRAIIFFNSWILRDFYKSPHQGSVLTPPGFRANPTRVPCIFEQKTRENKEESLLIIMERCFQ